MAVPKRKTSRSRAGKRRSHIKFSTKNFQLYIEAKQLLVTNEDNNIFNKPIINKYRNTEKSEKENNEEEKVEIQEYNHEEERNEIIEENLKEHEENINEKNEYINEMTDNKIKTEMDSNKINKAQNEENKRLSEPVNIATNEKEKTDELVEYVPTINEDIEVVELEKLKIENKKRHYEEYIAAKNKAKEARKETLKLIAEAKKIKNIYMLEDLDDNDESEEDEYSEDEYSENEYSENDDK